MVPSEPISKLSELLTKESFKTLNHALIDEKILGLNFNEALIEFLSSPKSSKRFEMYMGPIENHLYDPDFESQKKSLLEFYKPANLAGVYINRCIELIRDLSSSLQPYLAQRQMSARQIKLFSTTLYTFICAIKDVYNHVNGNSRRYYFQQSRYKEIFQDMAKTFLVEIDRFDEELKIVRDKIGAHLDREAIIDPMTYWKKISFSDFFNVMRICLTHVSFLTTVEEVYAWRFIREDTSVLSLTTEEFRLANFFFKGGAIADINTEFIPSVKNALLAPVIKLMQEYNSFVRKEERFVFKANTDGTFNIAWPKSNALA